MSASARSDADPVGPGERVLRRFTRERDYAPGEPLDIAAFSPNANDVDGLSVFRQGFATPQEVGEAGTGIGPYAVAGMVVSALNAIGVSVVSDPQCDELPGHSLMPELGVAARKNNKRQFTERRLAVCKLAADGVCWP